MSQTDKNVLMIVAGIFGIFFIFVPFFTGPGLSVESAHVTGFVKNYLIAETYNSYNCVAKYLLIIATELPQGVASDVHKEIVYGEYDSYLDAITTFNNKIQTNETIQLYCKVSSHKSIEPVCSFNDFSSNLGYYIMFCGIIILVICIAFCIMHTNEKNLSGLPLRMPAFVKQKGGSALYSGIYY